MDSKFVDFREIKQAVSMSQVLEHYGLLETLKRRGKDSLSGPCPIHRGKNPDQFRVSLSKQCWNCFGPCEGGNVLDFVAKMESVSIREAALLLAGWFGLESSEKPRERHAHEALKEKRSAQAGGGPARASVGEPENKPLPFGGLKHLDPDHPSVQKLGFKKETIRYFEAGYCQKGMMQGRIAIPIHNAKGELVAYVGKATSAKQEEPYKYPENFRKDLEVYNLHRAADSEPVGEQGLIVTTGFLDVFRIHEAGFDNAVALMSYMVSMEQVVLLGLAFGHKLKVSLIVRRNRALSELLSRLCEEFFVHLIVLEKHPGDLSVSEIQQALS